MQMQLYEILRRPLITEKATELQEDSRYVFEVVRKATKPQIKQVVEQMFKVNVVKVNVITLPGKTRRVGRGQITGSRWKKAIVSLKPGQKINLFEGV